ncbi:sulfatase [Pendulispora rubella]|uniref:Sulfatase n=1 Tax=Pendulispora rubella TaxID=2741070 RepID=A0ABZ2L5Q4_9BACT
MQRSIYFLGLLAPMLVLARCSNSNSSSDSSADASTNVDASDGTPNEKANIVFVLTDDLSWNLVQYMPQVLQLQREGTTFSRYFVTDSLCCPSRSSIFTGKFPHNTGVVSNSGDAGGYVTFERLGNPNQTFATALSAAGYETSMMGKFLNGYPKNNAKDPGWSSWNVSDNGYPGYGYWINEDGTVTYHRDAGSEYFTDVLSGLATNFIRTTNASSPFFLETSTFTPHAPYTPAPRDLGTFNEKLPRRGAFNKPNTNPPSWLAKRPTLTQAQLDKLDRDFNLRVEAVQAIDDMIAALRKVLVDTGRDKNTYFLFSSDNGYHMGEHMLFVGKETAFDTDIKVPLIVVGPGVPAGATVDNIVQNIDLCPTFADIAGTAPPDMADGHSLMPFLRGETVTDWRNVALVEHEGPQGVPYSLDDPDRTPSDAKNGVSIVDTYASIRMQDALYVEYKTGETEYYDLKADPDEMTNTAKSLSADQVKSFHDRIDAIKSCHGSEQCWAAQKQ